MKTSLSTSLCAWKSGALLMLACLWILAPVGNAAAAGKPLNFIFILIDDMGWTDLGCYGSKYYRTPNIDKLASDGMKFTQAYAACTVCSPTRASIMTGKYPARLHITDWIEGSKRPFAKLKVPDWTMHLPLEEMNIAKAFKSAGYATASIGKWHLGKDEFYPDKQGFDVNIAGCDKGSPVSYFSPYKLPTLTDGPDGEFLTDRLANEAAKFIEKNKDKPFYIYLPHYAVHQPINGKKEVIEKYQKNADPNAPHHNAIYAALVESVDDSVGTLRRKLDELKIADRTVIIFMSDNGGLLPVTSNVPLRVGKGSAYEGGVREPMIVHWPGVTKPGSVCEAPVISVDFYPTLLEMAGIKDAPGHLVDGESFVPLLCQTGSMKRDTMCWHYPHYHPGGATPYSAIREGNLKLIEFFEDHHVEMYDIQNDISEKTDLVAKLPQKADDLRKKLHAWRARVGAQEPSPNPDYDEQKDAQQRDRMAGKNKKKQ